VTPLVVHRYVLPAIEAVRALVDIGDCREVRISLESGVLVVDVVEPVPSIAPTVAEVTSLASTVMADTMPAPATEPERKGGRLAQQAAIACGERGFWSFLARGYGAQVETPDEARAWLCHFCGVSSRADLDHEPEAGKRWREVQQRYRLWLDGYDD
jgi:hypothetical protein